MSGDVVYDEPVDRRGVVRRGDHRVIRNEFVRRARDEENALAAKPSIDPIRFLEEQLAAASPDLLRAMPKTFVEALMSAEADAVCGVQRRVAD